MTSGKFTSRTRSTALRCRDRRGRRRGGCLGASAIGSMLGGRAAHYPADPSHSARVSVTLVMADSISGSNNQEVLEMPKRKAQARWEGSLQGGDGTMRMASGAYEGPYSFQSRFEEGDGTNPEELIAAAHAGCFSMALSGELARAGLTADSIRTTASVKLEKGEAG